MAKEKIYIHDWWLSPGMSLFRLYALWIITTAKELELRRSSRNRRKWRLDQLLQRKASEGVKIYVILYNEVSSRTTPTDSKCVLYLTLFKSRFLTTSSHAKQTLTSLHENIMVQRSPSHFQTGTFLWAHVSLLLVSLCLVLTYLQHEKLCVVDEVVAFVGGFDICFGRWDTPQHIMTDDPEMTEMDPVWPGTRLMPSRRSRLTNVRL
jgi:phospholipase D1/2